MVLASVEMKMCSCGADLDLAAVWYVFSLCKEMVELVLVFTGKTLGGMLRHPFSSWFASCVCREA